MRAEYAESGEHYRGESFTKWQRESANVERACAAAAEARRWRDASPTEKLKIEIADAEQRISLLRTIIGMSGNSRAILEDIGRTTKHIAALNAEREALVASKTEAVE
jgi:hypothetical protein